VYGVDTAVSARDAFTTDILAAAQQ